MRRRTASLLGSLVAVLIAAAGCNASSSASSSASVPASSAPAVTANPTETVVATGAGASESPDVQSNGMTQTNTEWGRIWDALPRSFPIYPGSTPTMDVGAPVSGEFVVPTNVATATTWTKAALDATGLRTTVSGPLEDGSMTLDSVGAAGCAAKTTIARTGSVTIMTVLYGANCPFS
jgi:hypothetical protein